MIALQTLVLAYKILKNAKPVYLSQKISYADNQRYLRNTSNKLSRVNYRLSQSKEGLVFRAVTLFNRLYQNIRNAENINIFKQEARKWVIEQIQIKSK